MADQNLVKSCSVSRSSPPAREVIYERIVPGEIDRALFMEHVGRYEFAAKYVGGKNVLDVACGSGYGAPILWAAGAKSYCGIDISSEAIEMAKRRFQCSEKVSFVVGDACRLDWIEDSSIEVAVSFETIEHLAEPGGFLAGLKRVLVQGGILIVSTPNRAVMNPGGSLESCPLNPYHVREWNQDEFLSLLGKLFLVEEVLGQLPCSAWRILGRRLSKYRNLGWLRTAYQAGKALFKGDTVVAPQGYRPVSVEQMKFWQVPTYMVCVCKDVAGTRRNLTPI